MVQLTDVVQLPALFISHGMPTLAVSKNTTTNTLAKIAQNLPRPKAIVIMSAHWLTEHIEVSCASHLSAWHDYAIDSRLGNGNFHDFQLLNKLKNFKYSVNGHPELALRILDKLANKDIPAQAESLRPLDHGVWTPLAHMYPEGDVPIVQVSLPRKFDAYACYQLGSVLSDLRTEQILLIGSGSMTHNLHDLAWNKQVWDNKAWNKEAGNTNRKDSDTDTNIKTKLFKQWMHNALLNNIPKALEWRQAPYANYNHPEKSHLMPLFFALGAGKLVSLIHSDTHMNTLGMDIYRFD